MMVIVELEQEFEVLCYNGKSITSALWCSSSHSRLDGPEEDLYFIGIRQIRGIHRNAKKKILLKSERSERHFNLPPGLRIPNEIFICVGDLGGAEIETRESLLCLFVGVWWW